MQNFIKLSAAVHEYRDDRENDDAEKQYCRRFPGK